MKSGFFYGFLELEIGVHGFFIHPRPFLTNNEGSELPDG